MKASRGNELHFTRKYVFRSSRKIAFHARRPAGSPFRSIGMDILCAHEGLATSYITNWRLGQKTSGWNGWAEDLVKIKHDVSGRCAFHVDCWGGAAGGFVALRGEPSVVRSMRISEYRVDGPAQAVLRFE
jgi:hypothetical protein